MANNKQKKSGGARKIGRSARKGTKVSYKLHNRRRSNKLRRIAKSNGQFAYKVYLKNSKADFPHSFSSPYLQGLDRLPWKPA